MTATPIRNLQATGGITYARAKFADRLAGSNDGSTPLDQPLFLVPGNINSNAPQVVATASVAWTPDIGSNGLSALFYIDGRMTSDYNTGSDLFPDKEQAGFTVVHARIGLRGPDQRGSIEFRGQNLSNKDYKQENGGETGRERG